jgi:hypothetical protein
MILSSPVATTAVTNNGKSSVNFDESTINTEKRKSISNNEDKTPKTISFMRREQVNIVDKIGSYLQ